MPDTLYFLGQHWKILLVDGSELPPECLAISDWEILTIKMLKDLPQALQEEVLIHEVIELTVLDMQLIQNIRGSVRTIGEMADHIAEALDSHLAALIRENPGWFKVTCGRGE